MKIGAIFMALTFTVFGNWFTDLFDSTPTPPVKIPVDLSKTGTIVDTTFRVNYEESTYFTLDFKCTDVKLDGGKDCKEKRKFLGLNGYLYGEGEQIAKPDYDDAKREFGESIDKNYDLDGTKVPLKITLNKIEEDATLTPLIDKTFNTRGQNDLGRDITVKYLKKGKYHLKVENLKAFKELEHRKIDFRIQSTYRK